MYTMKIGIKNSAGELIETIETLGMREFIDCITKYQDKGYSDLYQHNPLPDKNGFDVMFIAPSK